MSKKINSSNGKWNELLLQEITVIAKTPKVIDASMSYAKKASEQELKYQQCVVASGFLEREGKGKFSRLSICKVEPICYYQMPSRHVVISKHLIPVQMGATVKD